MKTTYERLSPSLRIRPLACLVALALSSGSMAQTPTPAFNLVQEPITSGQGVHPNLLYIHDDSGSMYWSFMPDSVYNAARNTFKSPQGNKVYYDPAVTYLPPPAPAGVVITYSNGASVQPEGTLGNARFTDAWFDGYDLAGRNAAGNYAGTTPRRVNLSTSYKATKYYGPYFSVGQNEEFLETTAGAAHYYNCSGNACTGPYYMANDTEKQNFANWYSYYRTRNYAARAGVALAFDKIGDEFRLGWGRINKSTSTNIDGTSFTTIMEGVKPFDSARKTDFFNWLYKVAPTGSTPLRKALDDAGKYYSAEHPWGSSDEAQCRKSYTILMTDGYWSSGTSYEAGTAAAKTNVDGTGSTFTTPPDQENRTHTWSKKPVADAYSNTLADIAYYYWSRDLRPNAANRVVPTTRDPAFWQHMTTYTIGLGVAPDVVKQTPTPGYVDIWTALATEKNANTSTALAPNPGWPNASSYQIDDLVHAAVNGHGGTATAGNPDEFVKAMKEFIDQIRGTSPVAPLSATSGSLRSVSFLFEATYNVDWTGALSGYWLCQNPSVESKAGCNKEGDIVKPAVWKAAIPGKDARKIYLCGNTTTAACASTLTDKATVPTPLKTGYAPTNSPITALQWERLRANFGRDEHTFGDIINSGPLFVGNEDFGYGLASSLTSAERDAYNARANNYRDHPRQPMIYVGANDGMLHAFKAPASHANIGDGAEVFAYIPNAVFPYLPKLFDPEYQHRYFVDGSPRAADINRGTGSTPNWHTVLVGSTGAGGNGYFALDIENPNNPTALWDITPSVPGFTNLGATLGQATLARLQNGTWVAIFGNGYNSADNKAHLYIVNAQNGTLIAGMDIVANNSADNDAPNGLSTPLVIDKDGDGSADTVYAGDMLGNLWKFDLKKNEAKVLFKARGPANAVQPIYARPEAISSPKGNGVLVLFGTGKFFEKGTKNTPRDDLSDTSVQTFYGVLDDDSTVGLSRTQLVAQKIFETASGIGNYDKSELRYLSDNKVDYNSDFGFYIDLLIGNKKEGERVTFSPMLLTDRIIFSTLVPDATPENPCATSGTYGWFYTITLTGAQPDASVFDLNGDGKFDALDESGSQVVSGLKGVQPGFTIQVGGASTTGDGSLGYLYGISSPSNDGADNKDNAAFQLDASEGKGRESWLQLKGR
ncbi:MAG: hypothetical protein LBI92_05425 [Azoarcus sp.]|jgi:type IV pilus assembly protein PilY1|nr:hypothetical protein [Azoarcus sp.]